jgi:hypothetical protein
MLAAELQASGASIAQSLPERGFRLRHRPAKVASQLLLST